MAAAGFRTGTHPSKAIHPDYPPAAKGPHCPARGQQGLATLLCWSDTYAGEAVGYLYFNMTSGSPTGRNLPLRPIRDNPLGYGEQEQKDQTLF